MGALGALRTSSKVFTNQLTRNSQASLSQVSSVVGKRMENRAISNHMLRPNSISNSTRKTSVPSEKILEYHQNIHKAF